MADKLELLVDKSIELGVLEAKALKTDKVVFDPRSFLKCRFGCNRWGKYWTCPPHMGMAKGEFKDSFDKYSNAIVIKTADEKTGQQVALALEKEAMFSHGCMFAFALALCVHCNSCSYPDPCVAPHLARPSMDACGIDIGKTLEPLGFEVEFDSGGKLLPAWYSMVLVD